MSAPLDRVLAGIAAHYRAERAGSLTLEELGAALGLPPRLVSGQLQFCAGMGLVRLEFGDDPRRPTIEGLTPAGWRRPARIAGDRPPDAP
jgi:hypothetical protein